MLKRFYHHDSLRLFCEISRHTSFTNAASSLNMTKGAISYQIKTLEEDLGFNLFDRTTRGVKLTNEALTLLSISQSRYAEIEAEILSLKENLSRSVTVGVSTYFAARWLSPRLMHFMQKYPDIQLRIQPMIEFSDDELQEVDLAICWGNQKTVSSRMEPFLTISAFPVGNSEIASRVSRLGMKGIFEELTLLRDRDSSNAWSEWLSLAEHPPYLRKDTLIIPDPNVRVQAVINGQGIALMDDLVSDELNAGKLHRLSQVNLSDYGYFIICPERAVISEATTLFIEWLYEQAENYLCQVHIPR